MYEHHTEPLLSGREFARRLVGHGMVALAALVVSLLIGMAGFHWLGPQSWLDAYLNAAMLLGGMGPVGNIDQPAGKIFAGLYALYAGIGFLVAVALLFAPVLHRIMHKLHINDRSKSK